MRFAFACFAVLMLAACTSTTTPYYNQGNFDATAQGTRLSFEEAKSVCRDKNLEHNWIGDTRDLNKPNYAACMESYGYRFNAGTQS